MSALAAQFSVSQPWLTTSDLWVMATAACCAAACAIAGAFLVLRRMSLMGDAISHAILPGLALAFMLTESRNPGPMFVGALAVAALTTVIISLVHRHARVPEDSAIGMVFSILFAIGVILITFAARDVDLDPGCVLYGEISTTPLDRVSILGVEFPKAFVLLAVATLVNAAFVVVFFKELTICSFDAALATTMGFSAAAVHYLLMTLVAGTCVVSFESVGSVLVVTMLVAPPATAYLLTDRLSTLIALAVVIGILCAVVGYVLALRWNAGVAGMMSVVAGAGFLLAAVVSPRHGIVVRLLRRLSLGVRIASEDILGELFRADERRSGLHTGQFSSNHPRWLIGLAVRALARRGMIVRRSAGLMLTPAGAIAAQNVVRSHRLWESYLHAHTELPLDHLHAPSHRIEHFLSPELQSNIERELGTNRDPHGSSIPKHE